MEDKLRKIESQALDEIGIGGSSDDLDRLRLKYFGRKGIFTLLIAEITKLPQTKRPEIGKLANKIKSTIEEKFKKYEKEKFFERNLEKEWIDVTDYSIMPPSGHLHLITYAIREINAIFARIGFARVRYPEIEWDWYAFEGLNMPKNHPARDEWETFFIENLSLPKYGEAVLSPHTSSGQLREMERRKKSLKNEQVPIRMLNIAKCYRRQSDISHSPMFYQFEGLVVDEGINITHLKGTLDYFAREYFGPERKTRIRPFHFQFTEPSFEVDVTCGLCLGQGCQFCKGGWLELGGAGMVHPKVLQNGGIDPKKITGFAFGWGVERVLMMKAGLKLPDLRILYGNDLRFLEQF